MIFLSMSSIICSLTKILTGKFGLCYDDFLYLLHALSEPQKEEPQKEEEGAGGLGFYPGAGLWSGLSALSTTGTQYLNAGLDKLEEVSNKAYEALNDQTTMDDRPKAKVRNLFLPFGMIKLMPNLTSSLYN